jgi:hypothetical protein
LSDSNKTKGPPIKAEHLYEPSRQLSKDDRKELGMQVKATIYTQDPLVAAKHPKVGIRPIMIDWEPCLTDGPTSSRIAVVDYNADTDELEKDYARWDRHQWCFVGADNKPIDGRKRNSPAFRQVNVWAIIQNILAFFEDQKVMGRPIPWAFEGNRLIVVPHAGHVQNAFYDRTSKSLQFYYCGTKEKPIYTCLSHDIVAHETGHAILDGIRPYYNGLSSIQTAAFHEFIADLTAILSILRNNDVRKYVADATKGDFSQRNIIHDIAEQFGEDISREIYGAAARPYLRTAQNDLTMKDVEDNWSPYDCSLVMTGGMFEILTLMIFKNHPDEETKKTKTWWRTPVWKATNHFTRLALRALDFCPSVDIQFIDYIRAILHADKLAYPVDKKDYRRIVREVFHRRGFCSKSKEDHEGLCDLDPQKPPYNVELQRYDIERLSRSRTAAYHFLDLNRTELCIPPDQDISVVDLYATHKEAEAGRKLPREIVLEYMWCEDVPLQGSQFGGLDGETLQLLCGGTLVFDGRGNVLYFVHKPGIEFHRYRKEGEKRRDQLVNYVVNLVKKGQIGLADQAECPEVWTPAVVGRRVDGVLQLEATPHLRHYGGE